MSSTLKLNYCFTVQVQLWWYFLNKKHFSLFELIKVEYINYLPLVCSLILLMLVRFGVVKIILQ